TIMPLKLELHTDVKTLNDVQKLVGDINWVRPICGVTNADMTPLLMLLTGDPNIDSP
ncbi:POK18 protein, partial [Bucorvus abyssinicus]|nr:POK18 protein [Bucorvus abyssinicus]